MRRHRDERIKRSLGWRNPAECRRDLGYTAQRSKKMSAPPCCTIA